MPRAPRLEYQGAFYHVFNRGNRRENIFLNHNDYSSFENFLLDTVSWSGIEVYAWCLMPNHFHLLIGTPEGNLSQFMRRLLTRYARYFNRVHHLVGHVFQGRYRAIVCDKEPYLLELIRYIHLNPVKARGLSKRPEDWRWSSHRYYLGRAAAAGIRKPMEEVLKRFSKQTGVARKRYREFILDGIKKGGWENFYQVKGNRYLGEDDFIEEVKQKGEEPVRIKVRGIKKIKDVGELAKVVERTFEIGEKDLRTPSKNRRVSPAKKALVYVGKRYYRFPTIKLAQFLGRDKSAVSQMMRRMGHAGETADEVKQLLEILCN